MHAKRLLLVVINEDRFRLSNGSCEGQHCLEFGIFRCANSPGPLEPR